MEKELNNQIELARREAELIEKQGQNDRSRAHQPVAAAHIQAQGHAEQRAMETTADANHVDQVSQAEVRAELARMAIYRKFPADIMMALAARRLAGKLKRIDHLSLSPDMLSSMLSRFMGAGTEHLQQLQGH